MSPFSKMLGTSILVAFCSATTLGGSALLVRSIGDYVAVPSSTVLQPNTGNFTVECWIKRRDTTSAFHGVMGKGAGLDLLEWQMFVYYDGRWQFDYGNRIYPMSSRILDTAWHHLAATVERVGNNVTLRAYLDGQPDGVATGSFTGSVASTDSLYIGTDRSRTSVFNGTIDEVRIWDVARSQSEINSTKNRTLTGSEPDLKGYWRFDNNAIDSSPNMNAGTVNGFATFVPSTAPLFSGPYPFEYAVDANTVSLWHMDETGGTVVDASQNANNGSAVGTASVPGRFGSGRAFSGSNQYIVLPASSSLLGLNSAITIEGWIYIAALPAAGQSYGLLNTGNQNDYAFNLGNDLRINTHLYPLGEFDGRSSVPLNRWTHIAMTYDGNVRSLYINGVLDTSMAQQGSFGGSPQAKYPAIGAYYYNGAYTFFFNGTLDEFRISNIARNPNTFSLQLPPKNLTGVASSTIVNLNWQNGGGGIGLLRYKLYRGNDSTSVVLLDSSFTPAYADSAVVLNKKYYYRVSSVDSSGSEGAQSVAFGISTSPVQVGQVTLVYPPDRASVGSTIVAFLWTKPIGSPTGYMFDLATDSLFTFRSADSTLTDTSKVVSGLSGGQVYWWRVSAKNGSGWGAYSTKRRFVISLTGIDQQAQLPSELMIDQNYPNPFNPSTTIRYTLPVRSEVLLTVYNTLGQLVSTLVNGTEDAGYYEVKFDGSNLASGVYFYRIIAGSFVQTRKLLLIR